MDFAEGVVSLGDSIAHLNSIDLKSLCCYLNHVYGVRLTSVIAPDSIARKIKIKRDSHRYDVRLKSYGENKINAIKAVRELLDASLIDAKRLVEATPVFIKVAVCEEDAKRFKSRMEEAGCLVEVVPTSLPVARVSNP